MGNPVTGILCENQGDCMMKYRNKKTGTVIDVISEISGSNWEKVEEVKKTSSTHKKTARKASAK